MFGMRNENARATSENCNKNQRNKKWEIMQFPTFIAIVILCHYFSYILKLSMSSLHSCNFEWLGWKSENSLESRVESRLETWVSSRQCRWVKKNKKNHLNFLLCSFLLFFVLTILLPSSTPSSSPHELSTVLCDQWRNKSIFFQLPSAFRRDENWECRAKK